MFKMLPIKGLQKMSLIDYPPYIVTTIFLGGCNFRCGYCHNPDLVLNFNSMKDISAKEVIDHLKSKRKWIDGVCITGGEPCLYKELVGFIEEIKKNGFLVKLDTNGTNPDLLKELIDRKLVDYIAMDIKTSLDKYNSVACVNVNKEKIKKSILLLIRKDVDYEFRTTVIPGLVGKTEVLVISKILKGGKRYCIQSFRSSKPTIDKRFKGLRSFSRKELEEMANIAKKFLKDVEIRE